MDTNVMEEAFATSMASLPPLCQAFLQSPAHREKGTKTTANVSIRTGCDVFGAHIGTQGTSHVIWTALVRLHN